MRPRDWGDPHPSDADDDSPADRTSSFSERILPGAIQPYKFPSMAAVYEMKDDFAPDPVPTVERDCYIGIILYELTPPTAELRRYIVLLERGDIVTASNIGQCELQNFEDAQNVICARGQ